MFFFWPFNHPSNQSESSICSSGWSPSNRYEKKSSLSDTSSRCALYGYKLESERKSGTVGWLTKSKVFYCQFFFSISFHSNLSLLKTSSSSCSRVEEIFNRSVPFWDRNIYVWIKADWKHSRKKNFRKEKKKKNILTMTLYIVRIPQLHGRYSLTLRALFKYIGLRGKMKFFLMKISFFFSQI